ELHLRLVWTMRLARQHQHSRRHALRLQRIVKLITLRDRHANVSLTVLDHCRRAHTFHIEHRRMLLIDVDYVPRLTAKVVRNKPWNIGSAVKTHQVRYRSASRRCFEALRLSNDPRRHETAVAPAHDAETIRIGDTELNYKVDTRH